jgi:hypothetical protein
MKKIVFGSFSVLALTVCLFTSQTSCTKETETVTKTDTVYRCTPTIQGLWAGTWTSSAPNGPSAQPFNWSIRPDGTASYENTVSGVQQLCVGTWTLTNGTWKCNTTCVYGPSGNVGTKQTFTATYDATTGKLANGTFVNISPSSDSGTFTITEVN